MPAIIEKSISILSDAGLGMAMFSLGQCLESKFSLSLSLYVTFPNFFFIRSLFLLFHN